MDKFTKAVKTLQASKNFKEDVKKAWQNPYTHPCGCLFQFCGPIQHGPEGCLTSIKLGMHSAYTPELTKEIRNDPKIPDDPNKITKKGLHRFSYWQRRLERLWKKLETSGQTELTGPIAF